MEAPLQRLTQQSVGGFRWSLPPGLRAQLLDDQGLRLHEWLDSGQARIVKHGPHRIVYRVELPDICFYIKHNLVHDQRTWLRHLVRPSKARTEFDMVTAASERGIPTIYPLALAEQETHFGSGESILVTRSLEECIPLHYFLAAVLPKLPEPRASQLRQQLAVELGKLVARIHDAGVLHHDLHAANLLMRVTDDDVIQLFVIDLLAVEIGAPLDWRQSQENLVMINCWFSYRVNRADRLRFWKAYFQARKLGAWQPEAFGAKRYLHGLNELEAKSWQRNLRFWLRRDKRCRLSNRYYSQIDSDGLVGHAVTEIDAKDLAELLKDPDAPFRQPGIGVLKESPSSSVVEMDFRIKGKIRRVIYKRFRVTSWKDPLASLVRHTPAMRSWIHGQGFRERGLPTARPFVLLDGRGLGIDFVV
jgi:tRNA A-37 threonylcarbamoyl transferase component Bud32